MIGILWPRFLIGCLLLWSVCCAPGFAVTTTPAGNFVLSKGNNTSIEFSFVIHSDPGETSYVFWAQQFWLESGPGGYLGIQRSGRVKQIIFSLWDATASVGLMQGAVAESFDGEGVGQHVLAPFEWTPGRLYRFRLESMGGSAPWWQTSLTDTFTGEQWILGKIQAHPGWGNLSRNVSTFTEVYLNNAYCEKIPYARAALAAPTSDNGRGVVSQVSASTYGAFSSPCILSKMTGAQDGINIGTRSEVIGQVNVHQIGISNGPQRWGDFDRKGAIGSIFRYSNPYSGRIEYFRLIGLASDGRYGYFPIDGTDNANWQFMGVVEPYFNGPFAHIWGEHGGVGRVNDIYAQTLQPGVTHFFRLIAVDYNSRYGDFPVAPANNGYWKYLGANIGK